VDLLVVGGSGLLGRELVRQALRAGRRVAATSHGRPPSVAGVEWSRLDIRRREEVEGLVREVQPRIVINAAYRQDDWATTADGGAHIALGAAAAGARLVHVSSDAVFSGIPTALGAAATPGSASAHGAAKDGPAAHGTAGGYDETRMPDPVTPYGAAKAAAETAVKGILPAAVVARTSLIIGAGDSPQERRVHALATGAEAGVLFTDDVRCPVHVADLAAALLELAVSPHTGVQHVGGADPVSRFELGVLIARRDGLDHTALAAGIRAGSGIPGAIDVRLDSRVTQGRLATRLRGAREFLAPASS
jgi:dTDP-4-dehydrorhamnose reductase